VRGNPCRMYAIARDWGPAREGLGAIDADRRYVARDICGFAPRETWVYVHCREERLGFGDDQSQAFRTFDRETMRLSIEWLSAQGYRIVLQGFRGDKYDHVDAVHVDSLAGWSFDLQMALVAGASAFIGSTSGLFHLASFFDVPCVLTNIVPADTGPLTTRDWGITKRVFDPRLGRYLSLEEMLDPETSSLVQDQVGSGLLDLVDNTGDEILSLCKEAFGVLGSSETQRCDHVSEATVYYRSLFTPRHAAFPYNANVGSQFLVDNSEVFGGQRAAACK